MLQPNLANAGYELTDEGLSTLGERIALPLQRRAMPAAPVQPAAGLALSAYGVPPMISAAHGAIDRIASNGSADLSQAFRGALAPVRRIIGESSSASECEARIREFYADWKPDRVTGMIEEALIAFAANGSIPKSR
jgi:hypothetical protein